MHTKTPFQKKEKETWKGQHKRGVKGASLSIVQSNMGLEHPAEGWDLKSIYLSRKKKANLWSNLVISATTSLLVHWVFTKCMCGGV